MKPSAPTLPRARRRLAGLMLALGLCLASGCATTAPGAAGAADAPAAARVPHDPWEAFNRKVYAFNDVVDEAVLKPVATAYVKVVPQLVRTGVSNALGNLGDIWSAANHLMQGKVQHGLEMGMRVLTNTFFGLGGLLDPATEMGLTRRSEDFGQTLGRWGVGNGPFLILPFLGPSTLRDGAGLVVDRSSMEDVPKLNWKEQSALTTLEVVDLRARLLNAGQLLDQVALDRYSFLRDAYLARRRDAVYDGAPPLENMDEFADEPTDDTKAAPPAAPAPAAAASAGQQRVPARPTPAQRP